MKKYRQRIHCTEAGFTAFEDGWRLYVRRGSLRGYGTIL